MQSNIHKQTLTCLTVNSIHWLETIYPFANAKRTSGGNSSCKLRHQLIISINQSPLPQIAVISVIAKSSFKLNFLVCLYDCRFVNIPTKEKVDLNRKKIEGDLSGRRSLQRSVAWLYHSLPRVPCASRKTRYK
jgi:hypothetical protein